MCFFLIKKKTSFVKFKVKIKNAQEVKKNLKLFRFCQTYTHVLRHWAGLLILFFWGKLHFCPLFLKRYIYTEPHKVVVVIIIIIIIIIICLYFSYQIINKPLS